MRIRIFAFIGCILFLLSPCLALNLKESIQIGLDNNPDIKAAQKKLLASSAGVDTARAGFFPLLKLDANYGNSWTQPYNMQINIGLGPQTFTVGTNDIPRSRNYSFSLSQALFTGGKLTSGYSSARKNYDIAAQALKRTIRDTTYNVTVTYLGLIEAQEMLKLAKVQKDMVVTHLDHILSMLKAGTTTRAEVLRGEVSVAQADVDLTKANQALIIAGNNFNNALGVELEQEQKVATPEKFTPSLNDLPEYNKVLEITFSHREEWLEFLLGRSIVADSLTIARSSLYPTLALAGSYGNNIAEYPSYAADYHSWTALLSASWSIFDLSIPSKIKEADANLKEQDAKEKSLKNNITLEVRNTYFELKSAFETIASAKKALDLAQENQRISELRFKAGLATNLDVIDAQVAFIKSSVDYINAAFDFVKARAKLNKVTGVEGLM